VGGRIKERAKDVRTIPPKHMFRSASPFGDRCERQQDSAIGEIGAGDNVLDPVENDGSGMPAGRYALSQAVAQSAKSAMRGNRLRRNTFQAAYSNNRRDAIENIIDADPVAAHVREIMADRAQWTGSAHPTFCRSALAGPAGQRAHAHSLADCAGRRPSSAPSELTSSSAARDGWERG
jgi:hypothetical protein